jgi:alpha-beta hydrolase superfamily lysophospholipase
LVKFLEQLRGEDSLAGVGYDADDIDELMQQIRDQEQVDKVTIQPKCASHSPTSRTFAAYEFRAQSRLLSDST